MLTHSSYGKERVRLVQVLRRSDLHDLRDLTVAVRFEGDYDASYTDGDNSAVLPTDTMKNTVYALAAREPVREPETFGQRLSRHFLADNDRLARVTVDLVEHLWGRIPRGERQHGHAFVRRGPETRTAVVTADRAGTKVSAGASDLVILKSAHSAFSGFPRDEYTTLPETRDRLLATSLTATWEYGAGDVDFGPAWHAVKHVLLDTFAEHHSESVQHTLHAMGQAVLDAIDSVESIRLVMPNRHHLPFDLARFGLENRNEIFVATEEPHGLIAATLVRS
jgi:urate oxidase